MECFLSPARLVAAMGRAVENPLPTFIPGIELCGAFYWEAVAPVLEAEFAGVEYSAALIGSGSEVLGFDTEMSADHHWGPRLMLFLRPAACARWAEPVRERLCHRLPHVFRGYPTNFGHPNPADNGVQLLQATESGPVNHRVEVLTIRGFVQDALDFDIESTIEPADWLTFPQQRLRTLAAGAVYHDGVGLDEIRARFRYYPHDVWLYVLAAGWARIAQEEHLMGRAGLVGDELGSALIGSRLVRDTMRLCFLMARQYIPYPKWFGTAFARLSCAGDLTPMLRAAHHAETWQERERHLSAAYEHLAGMHNALGITAPLPAQTSGFWGRPFQVIHGGRFADALLSRIQDPAVKRIASRPLIGSVDLFSDSTDLLSGPAWREPLRVLYT